MSKAKESKESKEMEPAGRKFNVDLEISRILRCTSFAVALMLCAPLTAIAILQNPDRKQVEQALSRGKESARQHRPPNELYWHFGPMERFEPHGFLVTKISGFAVMSGHYALRGEQPTEQDVQRIMEEDALQVLVKVFGHSPGFARDSYLLIKQGNQVVKPDRIRFDARAQAVGQRQGRPVFRAKIIGLFTYGSVDLESRTTLLVFPGTGGEIKFDLEFSAIP